MKEGDAIIILIMQMKKASDREIKYHLWGRKPVNDGFDGSVWVQSLCS